MKTVPEDKIELHLKLERRLACFVKVDSYFEDRTFDWLKLEKNHLDYKVTLVRSFDEGDEFFNDVLKFATVNELEAEVKSFEGDIRSIKEWIFEIFGLGMDEFHSIDDLKIKYVELVRENKLGIQLNDRHI